MCFVRICRISLLSNFVDVMAHVEDEIGLPINGDFIFIGFELNPASPSMHSGAKTI